MESVVTSGGHEIDYDRILVEELTALGHEVEFYVPEGHEFKWNYGVPVHFLQGKGVSYAGVRGLKKIWLSAKREWNRQRWYRTLFQYAKEKRFDAVIFPSATYRYIRAIRRNPLMYSPVPVLFVIHGLTPKETGYLKEQAQKVMAANSLQIAVQTFAKDALFEQLNLKNVHYFNPPAYIPRDINSDMLRLEPEELRLGFFGQYRKEKNLESFLEIFLSCKFSRDVKLVVQGATKSTEDAEDFERIIAKYASYQNIEFMHKALIGREWQEAINSVDALVMPYSTERYRYHTSAMLSTAIGFNRPVIIADNVNPEVLRDYPIGTVFYGGDIHQFRQALEQFVNTFNDKSQIYQKGLDKANEDFSPSLLAKNLTHIAQKPVGVQ